MEQENNDTQNEVRPGTISQEMTMQTSETPPSTPMTTDVEQTDPKTDSKTRKGNMVLLGLIVCLILAVGGVGFGIWAVVDGNNKVSNKDTEISTLKKQNSELNEKVTELTAEVEQLSDVKVVMTPNSWGSTEVVDGKFYVFGADGQEITHSGEGDPEVKEIVGCESSADDTILTCTVNTADGEGWFLYDAYGSSLESSF